MVLERDKLFEDFALITQVELLLSNGHVPSNENVPSVALTNAKVHLAACFKSMVRKNDMIFSRMVALMENPSALFFPNGLQDTVAGGNGIDEDQLIEKMYPPNTSDKVEVLESSCLGIGNMVAFDIEVTCLISWRILSHGSVVSVRTPGKAEVRVRIPTNVQCLAHDSTFLDKHL
ncbi:hypothetical protein KIN20_016492 [Parelaphostrongylus tenuis]|uniref:Uncharacterized protein n=1 Tax=Parelaphostrongylus tenuis TaxID=148309 RepID=A0AAD5MYL9_PARTN|nr:hypothetical protein KIN20_016492 [Parelaphostrongylus tenuis]